MSIEDVLPPHHQTDYQLGECLNAQVESRGEHEVKGVLFHGFFNFGLVHLREVLFAIEHSVVSDVFGLRFELSEVDSFEDLQYLFALLDYSNQGFFLFWVLDLFEDGHLSLVVVHKVLVVQLVVVLYF